MKNLAIAVLIGFIMLQTTPAWAHPGEIISSLEAPGDIITGLTFDGKNLWVADRKAKVLYAIDPQNGKIIREISSPAYWPAGLTWDGDALWNIDTKGGLPLSENYNAIAYRIEPKSGKIIRTVNLPIGVARGMAWDGKYLWVCDEASNKIVQVNAFDGTTIQSFESPTSHPNGLTFDGTYLWVSDRYNDEIYMLSMENGSVIQILDAPGSFTSGLTIVNENIYAADSEEDKIFKLVKEDKQLFRKSQPKKVKVTHTHQITNFGPGKIHRADIHLSLPTDRKNQDITKISFKPENGKKVKDKWNQETAHYFKENIQAGNNLEAEMTIEATIYDLRFFIDPAKVGSLENIPEDITSRYLQNNEKYQYEHPVIQAAVKQAIGSESNPYWQARYLFNYLIENMYYEMAGGWNTAPAVLERGNGSCSEYSFTYIAMCRAAGIPARYVGSVVIRGDLSSMDDVFHRWVEIYLPNYGWIPVDASRGDKKSPRDQADAIGHLANQFIITTQSGGGSKTMEWTYNSNAWWTTDPKAFVVSDHFSDWEPVE